MPADPIPHLKGQLVTALVGFFGEDVRRITHALDVLHESEKILEGTTSGCDRDIVVAAALLHDVGIKPAEEALGYNDGPSQERYGPPVAKSILESLGFPCDKTAIVCDIIGNHHSPSRYSYPELELLKKADRVVNSRSRRAPSQAEGSHD